MRLWAGALLVGAVVSCGGGNSLDALKPDGGGDAPPGDEAGFACGDARCESSQICLYPPYGCVAEPLPDSGVCPDGTAYSDATGGCVQSAPPPSCVSPGPGEGSFDCSGPDAGLTCGTVNAPIPDDCSRVCRSICA